MLYTSALFTLSSVIYFAASKSFKAPCLKQDSHALCPIPYHFFSPNRMLISKLMHPLRLSKTYPSFLTLKEGSTSHLGLLPSGKKRKTALLGAQNRYAIRLADQSGLRHIMRDGTALMQCFLYLILSLI